MSRLVRAAGLLAVTLCFLAGGTAFAGGSKEGTSGPVTLRFSYYANAGWRETYTQIIDAYAKENPNVKIAQEPAPWDSYWNKFYADAAAGTSPDVMLMSGAQFQQAASKGIFLDLGPFLKTTKLDMSKYFTEAQNSVYKGPGTP